MYKAEKKKLQDWLETWWLRFTDVRWSNFGRKEAELAVQILDRWAGPRLWSWKRWRFSLLVTLLALTFAIVWTNLRVPSSPLFRVFNGGSFYQVVPAIVALALSLSLTRFFAVRAGEW